MNAYFATASEITLAREYLAGWQRLGEQLELDSWRWKVSCQIEATIQGWLYLAQQGLPLNKTFKQSMNKAVEAWGANEDFALVERDVNWSGEAA